MNELANMFLHLEEEQIGWDISRTLDYAQPEFIAQIPSVLGMDDCDRADDLSKYAGTANESLAIAIIKHAPNLIVQHGNSLTRRRSARFRRVMKAELVRRAGGNLCQLVSSALEDEDTAVLADSLWALKKRFRNTEFSSEQRGELFEILRCYLETEEPEWSLFDFPNLLSQLDPTRARTYFASPELLVSSNPQLNELLVNAAELDSDISPDVLELLFDSLQAISPKPAGKDQEAILNVIRLATKKQSKRYLPLLEKAAVHVGPAVKLLGLAGQVKLRHPYDPIRKSIELLNGEVKNSVSVPVKVVGFTAIYLDIVQHDGLMEFAQLSSGRQYRSTIKALSLLKATPHVRLLTWLLDEVGEVPRKALRKLSKSELKAIEETIESKSERLDFDRVRIRLYSYILANQDGFEKLI
ncbi:MAG: hypothetical protein WBD31_18190 [Rubripirellula sp.]